MNEESFSWYRGQWQHLISLLVKNLHLNEEKGWEVGEKWWNFLLLKYSEYWRFYHTNFHICTMLKDLSLVEKEILEN